MLKIEFGFGIEFKGDGSGIWPEDLAQATIEIKRKAMSLFGGFTIFQTSGGWVDPDTGGDVLEKGRCLVVYMSTNANTQEQIGDAIDRMVVCIKTVLNQKAVAVCLTSVTSAIH